MSHTNVLTMNMSINIFVIFDRKFRSTLLLLAVSLENTGFGYKSILRYISAVALDA